jgi:hypothetical protein
MGTVLNELLEAVTDSPELNKKDTLVAIAEKMNERRKLSY